MLSNHLLRDEYCRVECGIVLNRDFENMLHVCDKYSGRNNVAYVAMQLHDATERGEHATLA